MNAPHTILPTIEEVLIEYALGKQIANIYDKKHREILLTDPRAQKALAQLRRIMAAERLDEVNRFIPNQVAEMASINYEDELKRTFDDARERIAELQNLIDGESNE